MFPKLKIMCLALTIVFAINAVAVSTASAGTTNFTTVTGATFDADDHTEWRIAMTGREVLCHGSYTGTAPAASFNSVTVTPSYKECEAPPVTATITGFGAGECDYVFHSTGTLDLVCPAGKEVTVDAATCVTHIPPQTGLGTITYTTTEVADRKAITFHLNINKMTETHTDGFLCPLEGSGTTNTATMQTTALLRATKPEHVYVDLTDHTG
jgi:hypothetical protein